MCLLSSSAKDSSFLNHHNLNEKGKGHNDDTRFTYESSAMIRIEFWMISTSLVSNKELFCWINRKVSCTCGKC